MFGDIVTFVAVLLLGGALLWIMTAVLIARTLLRPPRMSEGKALYLLHRLSPLDLDLDFREMTFAVRDAHRGGNLSLSGWWIPAANAQGRCAILLHGYADAKIGAIAWAPTWHALGFNVLALDLRAHGQSEGRHTTAGYLERHDVAQVIAQLREQYPQATERIVLFGVSLGAAVALAAANAGAQVDALVLESPFADYVHAATTHAARMGTPAFVMPAALWIARVISGADFSAVKPSKMLRALRLPVMVIHDDADNFVRRDDAEQIEAIVRARETKYGPAIFWRVANAEHLLALTVDPDEYARRIGAFIEAALAPSLTSRASIANVPPSS